MRDPFQAMQPQEAHGAFNSYLDRRFRDFDSDFQSKLKDAMKWEDKMLSQFIERNRLSEWLRTTTELARLELQNEVDDATMAEAAVVDAVDGSA